MSALQPCDVAQAQKSPNCGTNFWAGEEDGLVGLVNLAGEFIDRAVLGGRDGL